MDTSPALSPVMAEYEDWNTDSLNFPTWTESVWKTIGARMFLKGSPGYDQGLFALGIIVCLISRTIFSSFFLVMHKLKNTRAWAQNL